MKIENTDVYGWRAALRSMRNPKDSWALSDSLVTLSTVEIGPKDLKLACDLVRAGGEHRKFIRLVHVSVDVTAPRYWWQEADTYKVGTTRMSCSTMHKLGHRPLVTADFEGGMVQEDLLFVLNEMGEQYRRQLAAKEADPALLREMKGNLPESFLQMATWDMSYETALNVYRQRRNHRLPEWSGPGGICAWVRGLPYMAEFIHAAIGGEP